MGANRPTPYGRAVVGGAHRTIAPALEPARTQPSLPSRGLRARQFMALRHPGPGVSAPAPRILTLKGTWEVHFRGRPQTLEGQVVHFRGRP